MPSDQTSEEEDFARLLAWLGPDQQRAGEKYEHIRQNLLDYFRRRGAVDPLSLADEVISRVTKKVRAVSIDFEGDPAYYFLAVARKVLAEWRRQPVLTELPEHIAVLPEEATAEMKELLLQSLEHCLTILPPQKQQILLRYCLGTPARKLSESRELLAHELGLSLNALRVMAHRLKSIVKRCIEKTVKKAEMVSPNLHN